MMVGMFIMPISAFAMAVGNVIGGEHILGMHPVAFMMVVGIAFQGFAESFISPRFLEYFSLQAPKGEEGLYLGFSHLHSFLSYIVGFAMSGVMLDRWCPEPTKLPEAVQQQRLDALAGNAPVPDAYAHALHLVRLRGHRAGLGPRADHLREGHPGSRREAGVDLLSGPSQAGPWRRIII
jgi:hypothetical protein